MNTAWSAQSSNGSDKKRKFRETNHTTLRKLRLERLKGKGFDAENRKATEERLRKRVTEDPVAADFLMSLFASSLSSYKKASVCEPFPDAFTKGDEKNYEEVEDYVKAFPDMKHFKEKQMAISNLPLSALKLLDWTINTGPYQEFNVEQVDLDQYKRETMGIDSKQSKSSDPNFIFKVNYTNNHPNYSAFMKSKEKYGSKMGYHGSEFSNFYSILHNGLDATFGKETSLYGEGIYLSEDRDVAYSFLKCGKNSYANSCLGSQVGCIVCCEVVKHPKYSRFSSEQTNNSPITVSDDESKLPKGYIVVEDNSYVLVKYILVYKDFHGDVKTKTNFCQVIAFCYIAFLLILYIMRSSTFKKLYAPEQYFEW
jgi:hypothetical protein